MWEPYDFANDGDVAVQYSMSAHLPAVTDDAQSYHDTAALRLHQTSRNSQPSHFVDRIPLALTRLSSPVPSTDMSRSVSSKSSVSSPAARPSSASSLSSGVAVSAAERKRRRVEKHRVVDAVRRSREAQALSRLLEVLRDEQLLQERADNKRAKSTAAPRSRAQVLETAVTRLRAMRTLLSGPESTQCPPVATDHPPVSAASSVASSASAASSISSPASFVPTSPATSLDTTVEFSGGRYESLFRCAPDHTMLFSAHTRTCLDVSDEFCAYSGYSNTQVIGTVVDLCPYSAALQLAEYGIIDCSAASAERSQSRAAECIPEWQVSLNRQQLISLFEGRERRVQCLFRLVLHNQSQVDGWFRCWTVGRSGSPSQLLVIQTTAESYLAAA